MKQHTRHTAFPELYFLDVFDHLTMNTG